MAVLVKSAKYQFSHGHTPRGAGLWAFELDGNPQPILIRANYQDALARAKQLAQHTVEVLP